VAKELTTTEALAVLKRRRVTASYRMVAYWAANGFFEGAHRVDSPRGPYWLIPEKSVINFTKPPRGRPRKPKPEARRPGRGRKG